MDCENNLLRPTEAAKLLHVTEETLAIWRCTKRYNLPYIKIGGRVFYKKDDITSFIDKSTHHTTQGA